MSTRKSAASTGARVAFGASLIVATTTTGSVAAADPVTNAITSGKAYANIRMRYENVNQETLDTGSALTIRSRLGYGTGTLSGFSGTLEFEDSRAVAGVDDYNSTQNGKTTRSVIADPKTTEVDQSYLQYKNTIVTAKLGRQVLIYDNQRFIGDVGWRQDRQTFDALSVAVKPLDALTINYAYLNRRNRIFAEAQDINSKDNLLNVSYKTAVGTLIGYAYLLQVDDSTELSHDTYGARFSGATDAGNVNILYAVEFAAQKKDDRAGNKFNADYKLLEGGVGIAGYTLKLGLEILGSDDGMYGFATPLATLHKFNGWADQFLSTPNQGLVDKYASVGGKLFGGGWTAIYHKFNADKKTGGVDDMGDEYDAVYGHGFGKNYKAGIKYAAYSAGDINQDTDKLWVWVSANF